MQQLTAFHELKSDRKVAQSRFAIQRAFSLLAVAIALSLSPAFAEDTVESKGKSTKNSAVKESDHSESAAIPECLTKLKLSSTQEDQIKDILRSYDVSMNTAWKQFHDRYMQAIKAESSMLAAIEDSFTDEQRQRVRNSRRKTAQHEKATGRSDEKHDPATSNASQVVKDELADTGVTLTAEQEATADKIQQKYRSHLRTLNRDIHGLHARLLSLEADKLASIEKVLNKDQLAQLRADRQNAPETANVRVSKTDSTKTE